MIPSHPVSRSRFLPANRIRGFNRLCLGLILSTAVSVARASPGDYDGAFGDGGIARFPATTANVSGVARDLVQLQDGSLLVAGSQGFGPLLAKLSSSGVPDTTFGINGFDNARRGTRSFQDAMVVTPVPANQFIVVEAHGDPCAGPAPLCPTLAFRDVFARRINSNGTADPTYGTGGATLIPSSQGSMAVSPVGALSVLTQRPAAAVYMFGVAALLADGQRDPAFEQRALDALNCGPQFAAGSNPVGVTRWSGGKLLVAMGVAASPDLSAPRTLCVSRLNEDGSLDTSFATSGHLIFQTASLIDHFPFKILVRSDGRILIVLLDAPPYAIHRPAFVWLTPNGGLDTTFVAGGTTYPATVLVASVIDVSLQADDRILVVGYNSAGSGAPALPLDPMRPVLARIEANGASFDATFGTMNLGFRTLTTFTGWMSPQKVLAGAGGGIFVLGTFVTSTPTPADAFVSGDFAVAKLRDAPNSGSGGGGGCGFTTRGVPPDPTLPLIMVTALIALLARRSNSRMASRIARNAV